MTETAKKWKQVPWLRIGAEAVAIIASILIAFSLDAWWDGRELVDRELRYLQSLESDFLENRANIDRVIQVQTAVLEATRKLVRLGATAAVTPGADSIKSLVTLVLQNTNIAQPMNLRTYQELLNTSSFQVLRSDSLRTLLADFGVRSQTLSGVVGMAAEEWNREVNQHLLTRLDLASLLPPDMLGPEPGLEILPTTVDMGRLPHDLVFRNIMVGRLALTTVKLSMYRELGERAEEILAVLGSDSGR